MTNVIPILFLVGIIALSIFLIVMYFKHFKRPVISCVYCITGAPRTGKTNLSVTLAVKEIKKNLFLYYVRYYFFYALYYLTFKKYAFYVGIEKPMLYSNMPLAKVQYNELTLDIIYRRVRMPYKSVVLWDEVSLFCDSQMYKDEYINTTLLLFIKLFGHETHSGKLIYNTQDLSDCHYAFRRCSGRYMFLYASSHHPFVNVYEGIELINCEANQGGVNNVINGDIQKACYKMLYSSKYFKMYDTHYLSNLTDSLPVQVDYTRPILVKKKDNLKAKSILTFRKDKRFVVEEELS